MNYYELLEISSSASVEVVRNAYKTLAKKYHPDTYQGDTAFAEEKMKLLNEAVSVLEDEDKRAEYNRLNGINPLSRSGYSEYGRNNMINVDENGEPIFYSYDTDDPEDYDKPDDDNDDELYMERIDDFINGGQHEENKKKKPSKKKNTEIIPDEVISDIAADIAEINAKKFGADDDAAGIETETESGENSDADFDAMASRDKSKMDAKLKSFKKWTKIYYIGLAIIVTAIISVAILILNDVNFSNISDLFSVGNKNNGDNHENSYTDEPEPSDKTDETNQPPVVPPSETTEDTSNTSEVPSSQNPSDTTTAPSNNPKPPATERPTTPPAPPATTTNNSVGTPGDIR